VPVKELVRYLLDNLFIDFQGTIDIDQVREFLRKDDSREARTLLTKLNQDGDIADMLDTLADTLKQALPRGLNDQVIREQLVEYAES
jgi:thioredoxin-like negative regulator of GroEL